MRGGVGSEHAFVLRPPVDEMELILFSHGVQQPVSAGVRGGEPGLQSAFLFGRNGLTSFEVAVRSDTLSGTLDAPPPKLLGRLGAHDMFASWCAGGGGLGDPLDRDPELVRLDAEEGLVSSHGAARDYGVVLVAGAEDTWLVDATGTAELRRRARHDRIGRDPVAPDHVATGRRLSETLEVRSDGDPARIGCRRCGRDLCSVDENVKLHLAMSERPSSERWPLSDAYEGASRFVVRRFFCRGVRPRCSWRSTWPTRLRCGASTPGQSVDGRRTPGPSGRRPDAGTRGALLHHALGGPWRRRREDRAAVR